MRLSNAINLIFKGLHQSRAFTRRKNYINFPTDVLFDERWKHNGVPEWIKEYWRTADILHVHNFLLYAQGWGDINNKRCGILFHQHGRNKTVDVNKLKSEKMIHVVSTLNLWLYIRERENYKRWFPIPIDTEYMKKLRRQSRMNDGIIRFVHSPTIPSLKNTDVFTTTFNKLKEKYKNIELVLIQNKTNLECLKMKAKCDICLDQLELQYGTSGVESMSFGQPVIASCSNTTKELIEKVVGKLPYIHCAEPHSKNLYNIMEQLVVDESLRNEYANIGLEYVKKFHGYENTARLAIDTYKECIELKK